MTVLHAVRSVHRSLRALAALLFVFTLGACARDPAAGRAPLLVFAASDLRDALTEIARDHRATGGDSVVLVFGSTGDLATQIANGAPADLFFAANAEAIDMLAVRGAVVESTRQLYGIGRLAVIARCTKVDAKCPHLTLAELANDSLRSIAIADPSHAPYGRAAKQAFERAGLWDAVQHKLVLGANISQADLFVTTGNADAGVVALSLLLRGDDRAYTLVDSSLHDPLFQTVAVVSRSARPDAARALVAYVQGTAGRAVMERYGFSMPPAQEPAPRDS